MTDYYELAAASAAVPCTKEQWADLVSKLTTLDSFDDGETREHNFELSWLAGECFLYSDNRGGTSAASLPDAFLIAFGKLLAEHGIDALKVGVAWIASRTVAGAYGGTYFYIDQKGQLWAPTESDLDACHSEPVKVPEQPKEVKA